MATAKNTAQAESAMTAAEAAKRVRRPVYEMVEVGRDADGKPVKELRHTKSVAVRADEVLAFRDYGDYVRVVTADGQKFDSRDVA